MTQLRLMRKDHEKTAAERYPIRDFLQTVAIGALIAAVILVITLTAEFAGNVFIEIVRN